MKNYEIASPVARNDALYNPIPCVPFPFGEIGQGEGNQYERGCAPLEHPAEEEIKEGLREAKPPCHIHCGEKGAGTKYEADWS